jgi:hypothetical protein
MDKMLAGIVVAAGLAVSASDATFWGIDAWKLVAAAVGVVLIAMGGAGKPRRP